MGSAACLSRVLPETFSTMRVQLRVCMCVQLHVNTHTPSSSPAHVGGRALCTEFCKVQCFPAGHAPLRTCVASFSVLQLLLHLFRGEGETGVLADMLERGAGRGCRGRAGSQGVGPLGGFQQPRQSDTWPAEPERGDWPGVGRAARGDHGDQMAIRGPGRGSGAKFAK